MKILSHRGQWTKTSEKNSYQSFEISLKNNFGFETDIRDKNSQLVISHDIPEEHCLLLEDVFKLYKRENSCVPLAINIKSCGLAQKLKDLLEKYAITEYFTFDMAIPDYLGYIKNDIRFFTRHSEYEKEPAFFESAKGIWLDSFISSWFDIDTIKSHIRNGKEVCIVSPELHQRDYLPIWDLIKMAILNSDSDKRIMICTDFPEEARRFFHESD